jgi:glycosyltransferase involved in cell wall biosynthesis
VTAVIQAIAAASPGDAVTDQALAWQRLLAAHGHAGEIVAEHVHPALGDRVRRLDARGDALAAGPLILHWSVWSSTIDAALRAPGPLAVCYHNVTPAALLRDANPELAAACSRARDALPRLSGRVRAAIADSAFNAADLARFGLEATVVPLLLETGPPSRVRRADLNAPRILHVGRIAPNKRIEDVIGAFLLYRTHRAPRARLTLVGSDSGFERYRVALGRYVERLGAEGVSFTGHVDDRTRDRHYEQADAYLCMSVHEGFCAPLVEAMAHSVPIVARRAAAVPETLGTAGLLVDGDLALAAEALHEVVTSPATREALGAAAAARLADLTPERIAPRLLDALAPVLQTS